MDRPGLEEDELSVRRLFAAQLAEAVGAPVDLDAEAVAHARVLRLVVDDELELFDGRGGRQRVRVVALTKGNGRCVALAAPERAEPGPRVILVQCQPKGTKLDDIVRMTTEIGVSAVHVALSERCVARSEGVRGDAKAERWRRIAREAARQSERSYVPEIMPPAPLAEVLARAPSGAVRAALMERSAAPLPRNIAAPELWLAVGPEGGFSNGDRDLLTRAGFLSAGLGSAILRTETAAVVGVALGLERLGTSR
ncbi:MAG: RsmE family RNA methyltransferase [Myxococcales bacterium]